MPRRDGAREQGERPADVGHGAVPREVESLGQQAEIPRLKARHRPKKLAEPRFVRIELGEDRLARELDLVLRLAGSQRLAQAVPEAEQPRVEHLGHATDVGGLCLTRNAAVSGVFRYLPSGAIAIAEQKAERDQRIEEVVSATRMESKRRSELLRRHRTVAECREEIEFDRGEQDLRGPEARGGLHDVRRVELIHGAAAADRQLARDLGEHRRREHDVVTEPWQNGDLRVHSSLLQDTRIASRAYIGWRHLVLVLDGAGAR